MLQELVRALAETQGLLTQIGERLRDGDPAPELTDQLAVRLDRIAQHVRDLGPDRPAEVEAGLADLAVRLQQCVATGDGWLARTPPPSLCERVARAYQAHPT